MPADPPIDFEALAKSGGSPATGGYPYSIRAADLMKNFVFATLDVEDPLIEQSAGRGGHTKRRLRIKPGTATGQLMQWTGSAWEPMAAPPGSGTHVLAAVGGTLQWIATEEC